jgi:hypothetical protein
MNNNKPLRDLSPVIAALSRKLTDDGKLIEAGWVSFRHLVVHPDAPPDQLREMRIAFFAGAQHLFASINSIMDEDAEPTDADLQRMQSISDELEAFVDAELSKMMRTPQGKEPEF